MIIRFFYTLILSLASPFLLFSLYKKKSGKPSFGPRWKEHFGVTPKLSSSAQPIWIHAVSVGECIAATPLIIKLKKRSPQTPIIVTTTTSTGAEQIMKLKGLIEHRYMPIDFGFAVRSFLKKVQPSQMLIMETELWPNTINAVAKSGIPITVVNARLSEKSYQNYSRVQRLFHLMSHQISHICCQSIDDAKRFTRLGISEDKLSITGSIKFDIEIDESTEVAAKYLRADIGQQRPIWIAASTHKGEDEKILQVHKQVLQHYPDSLLILVPRHPERFNDVYSLCEHLNFSTIRRSTKSMVFPGTEVYLGDTMGEMLILIGAADICFMGGSLIGDKVGGHNILEPAALGKTSFIGPSYYNFKEIVDELSYRKACKILSNSESLKSELLDYFGKPILMKEYGDNAQKFVASQKGAIEKTIFDISI